VPQASQTIPDTSIILTEEDRADIHNKHLISAKNVEVGKRYFYRAKIGGERKVMTVQVKRPPYEVTFKDDRKVMYVDVFGYGFRGSVQAKKLLVNQDKMPTPPKA